MQFSGIVPLGEDNGGAVLERTAERTRTWRGRNPLFLIPVVLGHILGLRVIIL